MSDEEKVEIDGITSNGVNTFTSARYAIALAIKPNLTAGDLERWLREIRLDADAPMALLRLQLLIGAAKAAIIIQSTDKIAANSVRDLDAVHAQWYGAQLFGVYMRYTTIDPN